MKKQKTIFHANNVIEIGKMFLFSFYPPTNLLLKLLNYVELDFLQKDANFVLGRQKTFWAMLWKHFLSASDEVIFIFTALKLDRRLDEIKTFFPYFVFNRFVILLF